MIEWNPAEALQVLREARSMNADYDLNRVDQYATWKKLLKHLDAGVVNPG